MAINKIKPLTFKHLKPTDLEQQISDGGNLYVRVRSASEGGAISFRYRYQNKWLNIDVDDLPAARTKRDIYTQMVKDGLNPILEIKLQDERIKQRQIEEQQALITAAARCTVNALFIRWRDTALIARKDKDEITRMFGKDVLPVLGHLFVEDVRKSHISEVLDPLLVRGVNRMAKMLLGLMRQMFRFAVDRDLIDKDPTASISKAKTGGKLVERDRVLTESEIRALSRQMPNAGLMKSTECAIWIQLSTVCRIGELSMAKFSHIDFDRKTWTIPIDNAKTKGHLVYLSDFALEQFKILASYRTSETWLFPNRDNSNHVCDKSITKQIGSRQSEIIYSNRPKDSKTLVLDGGKWVMHDLRRTGATIMGALKVAPDVIEKCMNHAELNKVKRIYQRQGLEQEQAEAWQTLGRRLELIRSMDGSPPIGFIKAMNLAQNRNSNLLIFDSTKK